MKFIQSLSGGFYLAQLEVCHTDAVMKLEQLVWAALPEKKKTYIVLKSAEQICKNLSEPHLGIGIFDATHQLRGMAFLLDNKTGLPLNGLTQCDTLDLLLKDVKKFGVVATVMVQAEYRQRGFMETMLAHIQDAAMERDYEFMMSEVVGKNPTDPSDEGNIASFKGFVHNGFKMGASGMDPLDGTPLDFLTLTREMIGKQKQEQKVGVLDYAIG